MKTIFVAASIKTSKDNQHCLLMQVLPLNILKHLFSNQIHYLYKVRILSDGQQ